ncbi:MAG TPA: dihydrolipoamide acetyltransferase family protein [Noviherbaspirillum sp.]|uniref:dihydrolipoamide acetyltransferase family protein n=1 Tax=Noviherbaspirillum sp. TaxID=1926288 RepID=UPI002B495630|nr:dihydrolipoamide acetyltransferase family protein [Noviherbaspirillum sp.]HJV88549.1 dihydrolipoamide acetyltransferase family protein [Noviherbaspirillum sp.]
MIEFKLPFLGADVDEGKLLEWQIKPGDTVRRGQVIAVVDTSKAAVDVESWQEGTVFELLAQPGETLPVGGVLFTLLEAGESPETAQRHERAAPVAAPSASAARRRISPAARKHAEEHGIDLDRVAGTGPDGTVTLQDVQALEGKAQPAAPDRQTEMRKAIAAAMSRSKKEIPHYYLSETVAMRNAQQWLAAANEKRSITERLLMAVLQLKAVALALQKYPDLNGFYIDGAHQPSAAIHVGVAISLRQGGLIAPAIHDVAEKTLDQLMQDLSDLVKRARAGSLRSSEMTDPTITVTNLGEQGVDAVYGIIYPPQVALVGFGRIRDMPWVSDGVLCTMPAMTASLAADHRVSDGHLGALFLAEVRERLQRPEQL